MQSFYWGTSQREKFNKAIVSFKFQEDANKFVEKCAKRLIKSGDWYLKAVHFPGPPPPIPGPLPRIWGTSNPILEPQPVEPIEEEKK